MEHLPSHRRLDGHQSCNHSYVFVMDENAPFLITVIILLSLNTAYSIRMQTHQISQ